MKKRIYRAALSQRLRNTAVEHAGPALNTRDGIWQKTYISCEKKKTYLFQRVTLLYAQLQPHGTPQKVTVLYNKQCTTALQPNVFLTALPRFVVTNTGRSHFPNANHCQIQLQTPQSVIIHLKCVTNVSFRALPSLLSTVYSVTVQRRDKKDQQGVRYVITYSRTQLYLFLILQEFTTTTCFGPICGPSSGCGWTLSLGYTSMRVVVLGA